MSSLNNYYRKIIRHDLVNKFYYKDLKKVPELKQISLNFNCTGSDLAVIASACLALELVSKGSSKITKSKKAVLSLKLRKGQPVGCVTALRSKEMYSFLYKLLFEVFPFTKEFTRLDFSNQASITGNFSFTINNLIYFKELEKTFYLFNRLPPLNIVILTNIQTPVEFVYLFQAFKLPSNRFTKLLT